LRVPAIHASPEDAMRQAGDSRQSMAAVPVPALQVLALGHWNRRP
jgi:hypothetical protein